MADLNAAITNYVKAADDAVAAYYARTGYVYIVPPIHQADYISDKWVRVVKLEMRNGEWKPTSVHSFVCLQDGFTKTLGALRAGDVHKPAGWKAPAKHARGSVFDADYAKFLGPNGVAYLPAGATAPGRV